MYAQNESSWFILAKIKQSTVTEPYLFAEWFWIIFICTNHNLCMYTFTYQLWIFFFFFTILD